MLRQIVVKERSVSGLWWTWPRKVRVIPLRWLTITQKVHFLLVWNRNLSLHQPSRACCQTELCTVFVCPYHWVLFVLSRLADGTVRLMNYTGAPYDVKIAFYKENSRRIHFIWALLYGKDQLQGLLVFMTVWRLPFMWCRESSNAIRLQIIFDRKCHVMHSHHSKS